MPYLPLTSKEVVKYLPYKVLDEPSLASCLQRIFEENVAANVHMIASLMLHTLPKGQMIESKVAASFCIADAFLRKNDLKITLRYATDPSLSRNQQVAKAMALCSDVVSSRISVSDLEAWLHWHVIETSWDDEIWEFDEDQKDFVRLLDRWR